MPHITHVSKYSISEISEKQAHALGIIRVLVLRNPDIPPPITEIAKYLQVSKQATWKLLEQLQRKGYIEREGRQFRLTDKELPFAKQKGRAA